MIPILFKVAFAGLRKRRLSTVLTVLLSASLAAIVVMALEVGSTARDPWQRTFDAANGAHVLAYVPTQADAQAIGERPGVSEAGTPAPSYLVSLGDPASDIGVEMAGLTAPPTVNIPLPARGTTPDRDSVVLERSFADGLGLREGASIQLTSGDRSVSLTVIGTAVVPSQPRYPRHKPGLAWVDRGTFERLATDTSRWRWTEAVRLQDPGAADSFASDIVRSLGPAQTAVMTWQQQRQEALLDTQLTTLALTTYALVLGIVVLAIVVILVGARAREQYREIGLLKAVGLTPRQVALVFAIETAALGTVGVLLGFGVGALVAPRLAAPAAQTMLGSPTIQANPWHILVTALPVLLVLVIGTWASTRRRSRLGVVSAIQAGSAVPASRSRVVRFIARRTHAAPVDLGLRNLAAARNRAITLTAALIVTGSAVVFALSMQASLNARPAGEASDVPNELPVLIYTLDALLLLIAVMALIAVALLSVREQMREYGVLKTLGFTPGQVTLSLVSGHALLALGAAVLSVPVGIGLYVAVYGIAGGSSEDRVIAPWWWLSLAVVGIVAMASAAISLPARLATRMRVADALRYE